MPVQPVQRIRSTPDSEPRRAMKIGDIVMIREVFEAVVRRRPLMKSNW